MRRSRSFILIGFLLLCVACSDPYRACLKASAYIGTGIGQGMQTVDQLQKSAAISASEANNVLDYLKFANDADKAFLACADGAHASKSKPAAFTTCATVFSTAINNPKETALIRVSNPSAQATINNIVQAIVTGVNAVEAAIGGN